MAKLKLGVAVLLLVLTAFLILESQSGVLGPAEVTCSSVGKIEPAYNVLVVGESWAVGDRLFPDLQQNVSARLSGRTVKACTIGFSGRNSRKLYEGMIKDFPETRIDALFGGKAPNNVVILNGVNDEIQHVGAETYASYTNKIANYFRGVDVEVVQIPRVDEKGFSPGFLRSTKRRFQSYLYDGGRVEVHDTYQAALQEEYPEIHVIPFDEFIPSYEAHPEKYQPDGIHLTPASSREYGAFIGTSVNLLADSR